MVAGESDSRIQTALVAKWPEPIDVKDGIFVPGRVEKWNRELTAALRTRGLLQSLRTRAPSIEELCDQFPNEDVDVVVELYDDIMAERQRHLETVADNLPSVVLYSSMTMSDQLRFNALASDGAGDQLYAMVMELCDISCGRAQDKLQSKYVEVALQPSDSVARVISQMELRWWLFKHNRMYCQTNVDTRNDLEGIRQMLLMLGNGPPAFAMQAHLELPQLSVASCPDATAWMKARTDHLLRYGEHLMAGVSLPGMLHSAIPEGGGEEATDDEHGDVGSGGIVYYNASRGFGFIRDAEEERIYFHVSDVAFTNRRAELDDAWEPVANRDDSYWPVWFRYFWNDEREEWNAINIQWQDADPG